MVDGFVKVGYIYLNGAAQRGTNSEKDCIMNKKTQAKIKTMWKQGRNVWEISQLTGISETDIQTIIRTM